jgi:hypothetical protein
MTGRRSIMSLCMLCALISGATAAQSASAAGTTDVTCKPTEQPTGFSDAHCLNAVVMSAKFKHVEIAAGTLTDERYTNANTNGGTTTSTLVKLVTKKSGVTVEIECAVASGTGTSSNVAGPPMRVEGTQTSEFKTCKVLKPANCTVAEPIKINEAKVVTFHTGAGEKERGIKISPKETLLTNIVFSGASCPLPGTFPVEGKAIGRPNGATVLYQFGEDELTFAKEPADLQAVFTLSGRLSGSGESFTPLALTTSAS